MKTKIVFLVLILLFMVSCTSNARARTFGGTETIKLYENEVLMNATWKETDLWCLVKDTVSNKIEFREYSSFGILEGKIKFE